MKNYVIALLASAAVGALASTAQAGVVIHDDFTSMGQTPQANWLGDGVFNSVDPEGNGASVDLVGPGFFNSLAPNAGNTTAATASLIGLNAVDLDGSTGSGRTPFAGVIETAASLPLATYTVTFALAGNLRGAAPQETLAGFSNQNIAVFDVTPASSMPYTWYSFTEKGSGQLIFEDLGPSSQQGSLLADVTISTGVPELSTWAMMALGFLGLGYAGWRNARRTGAAIV